MTGHTSSLCEVVLTYRNLWLLFRISEIANDFSVDWMTS